MSSSSIDARLRYAIRAFLRRPAFAALVVGTLARGIGADTAMFAIVDLIGSGLAACLLPARRATRVQATDALRDE